MDFDIFLQLYRSSQLERFPKDFKKFWEEALSTKKLSAYNMF